MKFLKNLQLRSLIQESSDTISVFEKISKNFDIINDKLFKIKTSKQLEIDALIQEIDMVHKTIVKNKKVKSNIDKLLND